ncbi:MAG: hypothetical protein OEZ43_02555 [Gammaproteobacteria bacterium]|nr:hypothetical protein [Gammaproteobacteria bacterium]
MKKQNDSQSNTQASDFGSRAATERAQIEDALKSTPAQRLAWLEEALKLAWFARNQKL